MSPTAQAERPILAKRIDGSVNSDDGHCMGDEEMSLSVHVPGFLVARTYAQESTRQRTSILRRFLDDTGDPPPNKLTSTAVLGWWGSLSDRSPATRQAHLSAVRQFLAHLRALGLMKGDPTLAIARPKAPRKPPVVLTDAEILRFLAWLNTTRDRAMCALMLGCGLRAGDVSRVKIEDIDFHGRVLTVLGKGGKTRLVPIPIATIVCLQQHLRLTTATAGPLILSQRGGPLGTVATQQRITLLLQRAGIKRTAYDGRSSHVLRRTCATTLLNSGATVRDVQEILGHETLATTHAYLAVPEAKRLVGLIDGGPMPAVEDLPPAA